MHPPRILETVAPFYAGSFDPAANLTENLPQGFDADILLLGCGDVRHILYTAFVNSGLIDRKFDITACDVDENVIARNILLFTLVLDNNRDVKHSFERMWNLYYHFYLDEADILALEGQAKKLVSLSQTLQDWHASPYGLTLRFCDETTYVLVRNIWIKYAEQAKELSVDKNHRERFEASLNDARMKQGYAKHTSKEDVSRSCAPLATQMATELLFATEQHWKTGFAGSLPGPRENKRAVIPNPVFAVPLMASSILKYPTDPLLSYHLATAHVNLTEKSMFFLQETHGWSKDTFDRLLVMSLVQFDHWTTEFVLMADHFTIRFTTSECFSLCYTLRYNLETGKTNAQHYRGKLGFDVLKLAESEYGANGRAPKQFDVIDTSTLSQDVSTLNLLVSAGPLLKDAPSSTLYTSGLHRMSDWGSFERLLCGHTTAISILLGLVPAEYWTNARAVSIADQVLTTWSDLNAASETGDELSGFRLTWKQSKHMAGQLPYSSLCTDIDGLVGLAREVYHSTFAVPHVSRPVTPEDLKSLIPMQLASLHHHPGTMAAFLRSIGDRAQVNSAELCERFLRSITEPPAMGCVGAHLGAFALELPTLGFELAKSWGWENFRQNSSPAFKRWTSVPQAVAITVVVPTERWKVLTPVLGEGVECPPLSGQVAGHLRIPGRQDLMESDMATAYLDTQISFGTVTTEGSRDQEDFVVYVQEDKAGWKGASPMIISYYVPTAFVEAAYSEAVVGFKALCTAPNPDGFEGFKDGIICPWETPVSDEEHVFITKYQPGQTGYSVTEDMLRNLRKIESPANETATPQTTYTAEFDPSRPGDIVSITGRLSITSDDGKKLLADKAPIKVSQPSPFRLDVTISKDGETLILPLTFPSPILKEGSRTRIARKSAYIEITAPLANPSSSPTVLDEYILPTVLPTKPASGSPITLNIPHLSLPKLPILTLDDKSRTRFLTTLTSLMFSTRERRLREETTAAAATGGTALSPSPRLNFKESLFTLFMLASGQQGGQTGLFALTHPERGGIHMLLFVSAIRLDAAHGSVVLDAAVLPFTRELVDSKVLEGFLLVLRTLECCTLTVDDGELRLWKRVLPALVERCRQWDHRGGGEEDCCEYVRGGEVPVSLEDGGQVLCGCGQGQLPERFVSLPEWETAAKYATRVAISPVYASALVEELVAPELAKAVAEELQGKRDVTKACRACGKTEETAGVVLRKCTRCLAVYYCSPACQKTDWKKHRMECHESEVYGQE